MGVPFADQTGAGSGTVAGVLGLLITLLGFAGVMVLAQPPPEPAVAMEPASAVTPIGALAVPPAPVPTAAPVPALPRGKGMWLHYFKLTAGGDPAALVAKAKETGLSHVFLRVGSSKDGFYGRADLDRLLPVAHAAGLAVVGWDFPYLFDAEADARRAAEAIAYTTPDGHRMDSFSADIETRHEGVNISVPVADTYSRRLRELVGPTYPLIATVPRPRYNRGFPFAEIVRQFDAVAPMVYWLARDPVAEVEQAVDDLAPLGKPVMPVGQAYDPGVDGGPPGAPPKEQLVRFIEAAQKKGANTWSFWVWHLATPDHWAAIREARP
ncbi:MAG TPA: hypothetical protein VEG38_17110 [Acidimicrobiia bacterium]|nr:hypothetical protein [Acidimicrobiia bacterium]